MKHRLLAKRSVIAASVLCAVGLLAAPVVNGKWGGQEEVGKRLSDRAEIAELSYCYAEATDTIGAGDTEAGKAIYADCFTPDAKIGAWFPESDPNGPPGVSAIGPIAWGEAVEGVFADSGYLSTQHLVSNIRIEFDGINKATMRTYLHATHVLDPVTSIEVANGTYYDKVVRTPKGWRIAERKLFLISFVPLEAQ